MKYIIFAVAPTVYQRSSLSRFNLQENVNGNGSYSGKMDFATEEAAKNYLSVRAQMYYDDFEGQATEHLYCIERCGSLTIDAVTARIVKID